MKCFGGAWHFGGLLQCFRGAWHFGEAACSVLEGACRVLEGACSVLEGRGILEKLLAVFWRGMVRVQYFICDFLSSVAIAKYNKIYKIYNKHNNNKL